MVGKFKMTFFLYCFMNLIFIYFSKRGEVVIGDYHYSRHIIIVQHYIKISSVDLKNVGQYHVSTTRSKLKIKLNTLKIHKEK